MTQGSSSDKEIAANRQEFEVGQVWRDETPGSAPRTWTVTRVSKLKVHLRAEYPEFTATATAWIGRIRTSPYWVLMKP